MKRYIVALVAIAMAHAALIFGACTPKAVDCRVEFLKMADAGLDGG